MDPYVNASGILLVPSAIAMLSRNMAVQKLLLLKKVNAQPINVLSSIRFLGLELRQHEADALTGRLE